MVDGDVQLGQSKRGQQHSGRVDIGRIGNGHVTVAADGERGASVPEQQNSIGNMLAAGGLEDTGWAQPCTRRVVV